MKQTLNTETRARHALGASPIYELRRVAVEEVDDGILISGHVSSFYHKQLAQELVRSVDKEIELVNTIRVTPK